MEKTALQQLIERLNKSILAERDVLDNPNLYHPNDVKQANLLVRNVEQIISVATELLPVDRDDAKDFFKAGQKYGQQLQIETRGEGKFLNKKDFDKYYRTKYGETDH